MLVGHVAVSLGAKRIEPSISLGALVFASMLPDVVWCVLLLAGIEHVQIRPGMGAANYFKASDIGISHSLVMDVFWAALLAAAYFLKRRSPRGAWILFGVVVSHWILDWISHRPDMPLSPGVHRYFGLGLWTSIPATLIVEGGLWTIAVICYARAIRSRTGGRVYAFWIVAALLTLAWYNNVAGPAPPNTQTAPLISLIFFSFTVAWAYWIDRSRPSPLVAVSNLGSAPTGLH